MIKYVRRFEHGKLVYLAMYNDMVVFSIRENLSANNFLVCKGEQSVNYHPFDSLKAAKNFCETSHQLQALING